MSELFSSPSKQGQQAASEDQSISTGEIKQLENYTNSQQQGLRSAIAGTGPNPYFTAASQVSPGSYAMSPTNTTSFAAPPPPTQTPPPGPQSGASLAAPGVVNGAPVSPIPRRIAQ